MGIRWLAIHQPVSELCHGAEGPGHRAHRTGPSPGGVRGQVPVQLRHEKGRGRRRGAADGERSGVRGGRGSGMR